MLIVPYLLTDQCGAQQAPATETEDVDVIRRMVEYSLIPTYRVTLGRTKDEEGVDCYRVQIEAIWLEAGQKDPNLGSTNSVQFDIYRYANEAIRRRFYPRTDDPASVTEAQFEEGFSLKEPVDGTGHLIRGSRFTRATVYTTRPGEKAIGLGVFRIVGTFPTDFYALAEVILALSKEGTSIVFFNGTVELQHPGLGTLTLSLNRSGDGPTSGDASFLWEAMDAYLSEGQVPRLRVVSSGTTAKAQG